MTRLRPEDWCGGSVGSLGQDYGKDRRSTQAVLRQSEGMRLLMRRAVLAPSLKMAADEAAGAKMTQLGDFVVGYHR